MLRNYGCRKDFLFIYLFLTLCISLEEVAYAAKFMLNKKWWWWWLVMKVNWTESLINVVYSRLFMGEWGCTRSFINLVWGSKCSYRSLSEFRREFWWLCEKIPEWRLSFGTAVSLLRKLIWAWISNIFIHKSTETKWKVKALASSL